MSCAPAACADCDPVVLKRRREGPPPRPYDVNTYPRCSGYAEREERLLAGMKLITNERMPRDGLLMVTDSDVVAVVNVGTER